MKNTEKIKQTKGIYVKGDLVQRLMQFYMLPELQKKKFEKIQLIFKPEATTPEIFFDENAMKVLVEARLKEGILEKKEGENVYLNEITGEIRKAVIKGEENSLHATFRKMSDNRWLLITNFLFNRKNIQKIITVAQEFLNSAEANFIQKQWHPFIDNLFSACELLMKIYFVSIPYIESQKVIRPLIKGKINHERITREGSKLRYVGIISGNRFQLLTRLKDLRWNARYLTTDLTITESEAKRYLNGTLEFLKSMKEIIES